jgi:hypothetical protein
MEEKRKNLEERWGAEKVPVQAELHPSSFGHPMPVRMNG